MTVTGKEGKRRNMGRVYKRLEFYFESKNRAKLKMHIESANGNNTHIHVICVDKQQTHKTKDTFQTI